MISVIITSYNNETTIRRAIKSVLSQTYNNCEVIVVDDSSTDNTKDICLEYSNKIKLISTDKNSGKPYFTRNIGIKKAKGDFITFIDADDYLDKNAILNCMNTQKSTNADIIQMKIKRRITRFGLPINFQSKYNTSKAIDACLYNERLFPIQCWGKLYRTDLIRSITPISYNGFWGEDRIFNLPLFSSNPKIRYEATAKYNYSWGGATSSKFDLNALQEYKQIYQLKRNWAIQNGYEKCLPKMQAELIELLKYHIRHLINSNTMALNESKQYLCKELNLSFWEPFKIQSVVDLYNIEKRSYSRIAKKYITKLLA